MIQYMIQVVWPLTRLSDTKVLTSQTSSFGTTKISLTQYSNFVTVSRFVKRGSYVKRLHSSRQGTYNYNPPTPTHFRSFTAGHSVASMSSWEANFVGCMVTWTHHHCVYLEYVRMHLHIIFCSTCIVGIMHVSIYFSYTQI